MTCSWRGSAHLIEQEHFFARQLLRSRVCCVSGLLLQRPPGILVFYLKGPKAWQRGILELREPGHCMTKVGV